MTAEERKRAEEDRKRMEDALAARERRKAAWATWRVPMFGAIISIGMAVFNIYLVRSDRAASETKQEATVRMQRERQAVLDSVRLEARFRQLESGLQEVQERLKRRDEVYKAMRERNSRRLREYEEAIIDY